ncbi:hypothetical protein VUR80DRAFT_2428 [Thermomyces stellatus]
MRDRCFPRELRRSAVGEGLIVECFPLLVAGAGVQCRQTIRRRQRSFPDGQPPTACHIAQACRPEVGLPSRGLTPAHSQHHRLKTRRTTPLYRGSCSWEAGIPRGFHNAAQQSPGIFCPPPLERKPLIWSHPATHHPPPHPHHQPRAADSPIFLSPFFPPNPNLYFFSSRSAASPPCLPPSIPTRPRTSSRPDKANARKFPAA